jgi:hypothetical protein
MSSTVPARESVGLADTVGAPGARAGVVGTDDSDQPLGSGARLCARTRTEYAVPLRRPENVYRVVGDVTVAGPLGGAGDSSSV